MPDPMTAFQNAYREQQQQAATLLDALQADLDRLRSILAIGGAASTTPTRTRRAKATSEPRAEATTPRRRGRAAGAKKTTTATTRRRRTRVQATSNGKLTVDVGKMVMDLVVAENNKALADPIGSMTQTRRGKGYSCRLELTPDQALSLKGSLGRVAEANPPLKPAIRRVLEVLGSAS